MKRKVMKTVSGTKEWASSNENIQFGCQHNCLYCYAKAMSLRHKAIDIKHWDKPILRLNKVAKGFGKRNGTIMFPTTHDIHPDDIEVTIEFLTRLLKPDNKVLIVSKPHISCIKRICEEFENYKDNILFRFSIGSTNDEVLKFWEPNAPSFHERYKSLRHAYHSGFQTSISCEPMLDNDIDSVVELVQGYVTDSIWLGKMNNLSRCQINNAGQEVDSNLLLKRLQTIKEYQSDANILKLYNRFKQNDKIKWKESIKKVIGLNLATEKGQDI